MKCENSSGSNDYILVIRKEPYQLLLLLCMNRVKILQKGVVDSASSLLKIVYITSMAFLLNFASLLSCSAWLNDLPFGFQRLVLRCEAFGVFFGSCTNGVVALCIVVGSALGIQLEKD